MGAELPPELAVLLDGSDPDTRDGAWDRFLSRYNGLLLKAAARPGGDHDDRMDRYQHLLGALRADDFRRLRAYHPDARSSFPSWLTVVARRVCVDFHRTRHGRGGRPVADAEAADAARRARRRLQALAGDELDPDTLASSEADPDTTLRLAERHAAMERALATLEPRDRLLIRLRFDDEVPVSRIAAMMGFPTVFHAYRRLRVVLEELRGRLGTEGIDHVAP